jgi:hypothetical protein
VTVTDPKLNRILENLSKYVAVPRPPTREAKPQKSWRGLKDGQWIRCKSGLHYRNIWIEKGTLLLVSQPTNKGVTLSPQGQFTESVQWVAENWRDQFETIGGRKPKEQPNETEPTDEEATS